MRHCPPPYFKGKISFCNRFKPEPIWSFMFFLLKPITVNVRSFGCRRPGPGHRLRLHHNSPLVMIYHWQSDLGNRSLGQLNDGCSQLRDGDERKKSILQSCFQNRGYSISDFKGGESRGGGEAGLFSYLLLLIVLGYRDARIYSQE